MEEYKMAKKTTKSARSTPPTMVDATNMNPSEIIDSWFDYSKTIGGQMTNVLEEHKTEYERLYDAWSTFYQDMGNRMNTSADTQEKQNSNLKEFMNVWKNYNTKMGARMNKVINESTSGIDMLNKNINDYTKNLLDGMPQTGGADKDQIQAYYSTWMDYSNEINTEIQHLFTWHRDENEKLNGMWDDFNGKIGEILANTVTENEGYTTEINKYWTKLSGDFGKVITDFTEEYKNNSEAMYNTWINKNKEFGDQYTNVMKNLGSDWETLYKTYFERTANFQKNMTPFPYMGIWTQKSEIDTLKMKVEELEKKLENKS
jgi:gas vesicle protein